MKWKVWVGTNSKYYFSLEDSERKIVCSSGYNYGHEVIGGTRPSIQTHKVRR